MNGRIEKESKAKQMMEEKLTDLPEIFTLFYNWMDARDKSYTTMKNYTGCLKQLNDLLPTDSSQPDEFDPDSL